MWSGRTNWLSIDKDNPFLSTDWTDSSKLYGYFEVYSENDVCSASSKGYGLDEAVAFTGEIVEDQGFRVVVEEKSIQLPTNTL